MRLFDIPFNGLFIVYKHIGNSDKKLFYGMEPADIPTEYQTSIVDYIYPHDDAIIVFIK